jgi:hypothetical protein
MTKATTRQSAPKTNYSASDMQKEVLLIKLELSKLQDNEKKRNS